VVPEKSIRLDLRADAEFSASSDAAIVVIKRYVVKISIFYIPNVMCYITVFSKFIKINHVFYWIAIDQHIQSPRIRLP